MTGTLLAFVCGAGIALVTAPVGVSGAVFLLPVQLDVLGVPNPSVTPTNLLYNVVAGPGALARHRSNLRSTLVARLLAGSVPGVVVGACVRVWLVPDPRVFRLVAGVVLLGLGGWLVRRSLGASRPTAAPIGARTLVALAAAVGVLGGVYGIGGGSLLAPVLVGRGLPVPQVAPAALASTFVTSVVGTGTFAVLALVADGSITPDWSLGLAAGLGGLLGGYGGASWARLAPDRLLRTTLGVVAAGLGATYLLLTLV